jgi:hypothetical protein
MFDYETAAKIIRGGTVKVDDKVILFVNTAKWNYYTCQQFPNTVADLRAVIQQRDAEIEMLKELLLEKENHD